MKVIEKTKERNREREKFNVNHVRNKAFNENKKNTLFLLYIYKEKIINYSNRITTY
jgi:hypothetical protein